MPELPSFDLSGKTALVTGAARGLGRAIALALADSGADVALGLRDASADGGLVGEIEAEVNAELALARDVRVNVLPRDLAFAIPDLIRTKVNLLPPGIEQIRTIEIVGLDLQADGGTHVANTREVGGIRVTGYESKGRINKRIRLEVTEPV